MTDRGARGWRFVAVLGILALTLAACTSSSNKASQSAGATTASAGQFCKGMKIIFFPGGTPGGGFETVVYNGAKAAQAAFGPDVTYVWSDWDPSKMITQFQQAVATKPDGIAVMGHPGTTPSIRSSRTREPGHPRHGHEHRAPEGRGDYAARASGMSAPSSTTPALRSRRRPSSAAASSPETGCSCGAC